MTVIERIGAQVLGILERLGHMGVFLGLTLSHTAKPPWQWGLLIRQIHFVGARSTLVIGVAGGFVGMVVGLQFYDTLVRFGSVSLLGSAVGLSLVRELSPVLTALIVIGRAGSAMCAEIGIMRSDNQIDSLECMAIDPYSYLIAPRFLAVVITVPLLTAIFDVIGIFGGWFIGVGIFEVSEGAYFQSMADSVVWGDIWMGIVKSIVFAVVIAWICLAKGFLLHLGHGRAFGAEGVSRVTTDAVVLSSISILFADYIISAIML
jgi:phospholipid/cholesterol/gamma-HCH transport system permease protein